MARDNKASTPHIHELEDNALLWNTLEKELKIEETDPTTFFIKFTLRPTEKK